jgi:hypothetical protein
LTLEVTGKNPQAQDNTVLVDAFDVGPSVPPPVEGRRVEETTPPPDMNYTAGWTQGDTTRNWSGGTAAVSTTAGAQATFTFTGTSVSWIGLRGPQTGIARIFVDGAFQAQVDTRSVNDIQAQVFSVTDLAPAQRTLDLPTAQHTLTIEVAGGNPGATVNPIFVDAFDVGSRFEERDRSIVYTGAWTLGDDQKNWSGNSRNTGPATAARSNTAGAAAEFTFTGTSVKWISRRGPTDGLADVFLDGVLAANDVDLYSATELLRVPVFDSGPLATPGPHKLRIVVTGNRNLAAFDSFVVADAFDVGLPSSGVPVRRFQEADTDPSFSATYTPVTANPSTGWLQGSGFPFWSGQTAMLSDFCSVAPCPGGAPPSTTAAPSATFTFTGTSVSWIGDRSQNTGIARVTLDGVVIGDVDTFANVIGDAQATIFSRSLPTPGPHTLTIEATGRRNPAAGAGLGRIVIDAIDIQD